LISAEFGLDNLWLVPRQAPADPALQPTFGYLVVWTHGNGDNTDAAVAAAR